jgi:hypothetical protein
LLESVDAESLRQGKIPKKGARNETTLRVITEPTVPTSTTKMTASGIADPATVRPLLAVAAAENVEQLKASLLEAAGSATRPVWLTIECTGCGERSRVEAPVPDVRARVAAIELLLREGLGRPGQAEEPTTPRLPESAAAIHSMAWDDLQGLAATLLVDELVAVQRDGGQALLRDRVAELGETERRALREALADRTA